MMLIRWGSCEASMCHGERGGFQQLRIASRLTQHEDFPRCGGFYQKKTSSRRFKDSHLQA